MGKYVYTFGGGKADGHAIEMLLEPPVSMLQMGRRGVVRQPMLGISPDFYMVVKNSHRLSYTIDYSHLCPCFPLSFFTETTASSGFGHPPFKSGVRLGSGAEFYGFQGV